MSSSGRGSKGRRAIIRGPLAAASVLVASLLGGALHADQETAVPTVERVLVEVDGRPGAKGLLDLVPIKPGDAYSPLLVDQAVKQIFQTGLFEDVKVIRRGEERVDLLFALTRNLIVDRVALVGAKVPLARLREALVSLRPGGVYRPELAGAAAAEVREGLRKEGYFEADVTVEAKRRGDAASVALVFRASGWKRYLVRSLEMEWKSDIPTSAVRRKLRSRVGEAYVPQVLEADLEGLRADLAREGYRRAEVRLAEETFDEQGRRVDLRVEILPQERIVVVVTGARVPSRLLDPIWEERVFEPWGLAEGEARILNHLRRKGFLFAAVESRIDQDGSELRIVHEVAPGPRTKIEGVDFQGQTAFSELDLKTRLAIREGVPFFALISYDRLFSIPREVETFYKENGFADAQVRLELVKGRKSGVRALFNVREGPRTTVEAIRLEGLSLFAASDILPELVSREDGPYFPPNIQRDVGQIEGFYLNRGIRGTEVVPRLEETGPGRVTLVYDIREGREVTIRNIFISGNSTTREGVIRRELRMAVGQRAEYAKIQESRRRLERLGIFSEVRLEEVRTGPAEEVVVLTVREGEKNYAGAGLGFESLSRLSGSLAAWPNDFRPRGTVEYIRSNVFGLGAQAGLLGQLSTVERRAVASWNQPYLFGLSMPTTVLAWAERENRESFTFDRRGVSLSAIKGLGRARLLLASLSLTRTALPYVDIENPPENIDRRFQPYSAALASVSLSWERRDDTLNPMKGFFFSVAGEWGIPVFGMESDYQKLFVKAQVFRPIPAGLNLGLTGRLGIGRGLRNLPERFFAGGSNTFRGEEFDLLGPLEEGTLKPLGGEAILLLNAEMTFAPVSSWRELRLAAFFDLGNVYSQLNDFRPFDLQGAIGAGLRYRTPLGPVRLEIAWKLWGLDAQDKRGRPLVFLTIGNIF